MSPARVRRVLVTLSGTREELERLNAAAELAASLEAELAALFVEDDDLLRACRLPEMHEVGGRTAQLRGLAPDSLERALRTAAERAERMLRSIAEARALPFSFRTARGKFPDALLALAGELDAILLNATRRSALRRTRPVAAVYDGEAARPALEVARRLAQASGADCLVLIPAADHAAFAESLDQVRALFGETGFLARRLAVGEPADLIEAANALGAAALVLPAGYAGDDPARLGALRRGLRGDLLILR